MRGREPNALDTGNLGEVVDQHREVGVVATVGACYLRIARQCAAVRVDVLAQQRDFMHALIGQVGRDPGNGCDMGSSGPEYCYVELQQGDTTIAATLSWRDLELTINNKPSGFSFRNGKPTTIRVANFPANNRISVEICPTDSQGTTCGYKVVGKTDSAGSLTLKKYDLNCVQIDSSGDCELVALDISPGWVDVAQANLFFTYGL